MATYFTTWSHIICNRRCSEFKRPAKMPKKMETLANPPVRTNAIRKTFLFKTNSLQIYFLEIVIFSVVSLNSYKIYGYQRSCLDLLFQLKPWETILRLQGDFSSIQSLRKWKQDNQTFIDRISKGEDRNASRHSCWQLGGWEHIQAKAGVKIYLLENGTFLLLKKFVNASNTVLAQVYLFWTSVLTIV